MVFIICYKNLSVSCMRLNIDILTGKGAGDTMIWPDTITACTGHYPGQRMTDSKWPKTLTTTMAAAIGVINSPRLYTS